MLVGIPTGVSTTRERLTSDVHLHDSDTKLRFIHRMFALPNWRREQSQQKTITRSIDVGIADNSAIKSSHARHVLR